MTSPHSPRGHVLVVDDDPAVRETLEALLQGEGHRVQCAADGREALQLLRSGPLPSLVLMDLMMPRIDGWTLRREMRQDPSLAAIPVVILSNAGYPARELVPLEPVAYFVKPCDISALLKTVAEYYG
jgi:CheY-like chemotaxis protein